jgi:3-phenylpropionate/trans-cinnamate dioxygenase ferredoxin component
MSEFMRVAAVDQIPPGTRKRFFLYDQPVVLFNVDGDYFCIADVCTHDGGPLGEGELYDHEIECPRHGALFDIRTGAALTFPATVPTAVCQVRVEDGEIVVAPA